MATDEDDLYPESDGRPFDSDLHCDVMTSLKRRLRERYAADPRVYVSGWLFVYFEEGNPDRRIAPDVFLVRGVPKRDRRHFLTWQERATPAIVIEFTSRLTREEDWDEKLPVYRDILALPEIFVYDPRGEYLSPRLCGFRYTGDEYLPIPPTAGGGLWSEQLGVELRPGRDSELELIDPNQTEPRPSLAELQAEIHRLRAEIARLRNQQTNS